MKSDAVDLRAASLVRNKQHSFTVTRGQLPQDRMILSVYEPPDRFKCIKPKLTGLRAQEVLLATAGDFKSSK